MKVFVTGHQGYIGAHLVSLLQNAGHHVTGCDIGLFEGCEWDGLPKADKELRKDLRHVTEEDLKGIDCVMHLGALSNDPMGDIDEALTYAINRDGSIALAEKAKKAGVERFLFSSSCSIYGKGEKLDLEEGDPTHPLTAYASSKIATEEALDRLADDSFTPASLRNATAYGYSPNFRNDLVVNNLLTCAYAMKDIRIKSDGTPWRPLIHCKDIARAFVAFLEAPRETIHNKVVNIGGNEENYQVMDVADKVKKLVPDVEVVFTGEVGNDPRNYRVNFNRLNELLPDFELEYTLDKGMEELLEALKAHGFNKEDFNGDRYIRLKVLQKRLHLIRPEAESSEA